MREAAALQSLMNWTSFFGPLSAVGQLVGLFGSRRVYYYRSA